MAVICSLNCHNTPLSGFGNPNFNCLRFHPTIHKSSFRFNFPARPRWHLSLTVSGLATGSNPNNSQDDEVDNVGVRAALTMLRFYKREISPLIPKSCRYVPTCSEYSMEAYKKYGVVKGTILTTWRLCRCNPLGESGFDPPRWFDETRRPEEEEEEKEESEDDDGI